MSQNCLVKTHYLDELKPLSKIYKEGARGQR